MLICVDWGTTNARAWLVDRDGTVSARASSKAGMSGLSPDTFAPALEELIGAWRTDRPRVPVLMSGMVGARGGWQEVPYVSCPFDAGALSGGLVEVAPKTWIVPGARILRVVGTEPVRDVMRGEEVQILGALQGPERITALCLPGTHSKWVDLPGGRIDRFATFMTGELFALLAGHSVLARSVGEPTDRPFSKAFEDGVAVGRAAPLASALFGVRTRDVVAELPANQNRAFLSGLLIGHELEGALKDLSASLSPRIGLCGQPSLVALYRRALSAMDVEGVAIDVEGATLRGHLAVAEAAGILGEGEP